MTFNDIFKKTKKHLQKRKLEYSFDWLGRSLAYNNYPPRDIINLLQSTKKDEYSKIYNIQYPLNDDLYDPLLTAQNFQNKDASLICVNTEPHFFKGEVELLTGIRRYVSTPLLRYDFIYDDYQLLESVVYGADSVLLMARILSKKELKGLIEFSRRLRMEPIVEICNKEDLIKAIFSGAVIISINQKDFDSGYVDESLYEKLLPLIPNGKTILLNGVKTDGEILKELNHLGIDGFFIS